MTAHCGAGSGTSEFESSDGGISDSNCSVTNSSTADMRSSGEMPRSHVDRKPGAPPSSAVRQADSATSGAGALAGITWPVPEWIDDAELERRLFPVTDVGANTRPAIDWPAIQRELKRRGGDLAEHSNGYSQGRAS